MHCNCPNCATYNYHETLPEPPKAEVAEVEAALRLINDAEGWFLIGHTDTGLVSLALGKEKLEKIVDPQPRRSATEKLSD